MLRRISVTAYEVEMNLVIHSLGGTLSIDLDGDYIWLVSEDIGPGIPDIESAMRRVIPPPMKSPKAWALAQAWEYPI